MSDIGYGLAVYLERDNFVDQIGREQTFHLKLHNYSKQGISAVFCFQPPLGVEPCGRRDIWLDCLPSEQTAEIPLLYTFNQGGRHQFWGWIKGKQDAALWKESVFLSGSGFYSGDTHTHSTYSDGKGMLAENRDSMLDKGHSFLYSTDHNTMGHEKDILDYSRRDEAKSFLHIAGWEFTSQYGHALAYGVLNPSDPKRISRRGGLAEWQDFVDEMQGYGGNVFLAHPYEAPEYEFGDEILHNIQRIIGLEVWNGYNHHALDDQNQKAFRLWDRLNMAGKGRYIGNAVSDAHTVLKHGTPFIKGYLAELNTHEVHNMLKQGSFFGSNGPEIAFFIDNKGMGDVCVVAQRKMVFAQIRVFDPLGGLERIALLCGKIGGKSIQEVFHVLPDGEAERTLWVKDWYFHVEPGEFYRLEAVSKMGVASYNKELKTQEKGFAFSNPIWVE